MKNFVFTESLAKKILIFLLIAGAFLRFYNVSESYSFQGDQGRDALIYYRLLIERDPVFIGPVTSVGNMYLGPAFYYVMLPFYALTFPSPVGPVYATALLGVVTIWLIYHIGKQLIGYKAALFASFFYTFGWVFIVHNRFSWNPNPASFVALLMIWFSYLAYTKSSKFWIAVSLCFAMLIQLHYLTLLALAPTGLIWLMHLYKLYTEKKSLLKHFAGHTVIAVVLFLLSLTPLVLFDLKHDFRNAQAFYDILFGKEDQLRSESEAFRTINEMVGRSYHIIFEITLDQPRVVTAIALPTFLILLGIAYKRQKEHRTALMILYLWLGLGVLGTALYKSSIFDHYITFLFPVTVLLLGVACTQILEQKYLRFGLPVILGWFLYANVMVYDLRPMGWSANSIQAHSKIIESVLRPGEEYALILLTAYKDVDAMNYRYFLTASGRPPLDVERINDAKTLVIIDEEDLPLKEIMDLPLYQIVIFPDKSNPEVITPSRGPKLVILRR